MLSTFLRNSICLLLPATALLMAACVPVPTNANGTQTNGATVATLPAEAVPAGAVAAAAVNPGLMLTAPVTMSVTGPVSPAHSIVGPVGGEHTDGDATVSTESSAMAGMDHSMHMAAGDTPVDLAFIDDMIVHHEGAIVMANDLLLNTQRPELVEMAHNIISSQSAEVAQMQAWRAAWYPDAPPNATGDAMGMSMRDMAVSDDTSIPYDQRFLTAMISHHSGALEMANMALQQAEHPEVKQLAAEIIAAQAQEIAQMQGWLKAWYGE